MSNTSSAQRFERIAADPSAWSIDGTQPPPRVWKMIQEHYIAPLLAFGKAHGVYLVPSMRSCYRSPEYERKKGRAGSSYHCFPPGTRGACDLVRADGGSMADALDLFKASLPFPRIAWYPANGFIHVDYGERSGRKGRNLYLCKSPSSLWVHAFTLPDIQPA